MIERLDYLQRLGVHPVRISPHYRSPRFDCGYDAADHAGVALDFSLILLYCGPDTSRP